MDKVSNVPEIRKLKEKRKPVEQTHVRNPDAMAEWIALGVVVLVESGALFVVASLFTAVVVVLAAVTFPESSSIRRKWVARSVLS